MEEYAHNEDPAVRPGWRKSDSLATEHRGSTATGTRSGSRQRGGTQSTSMQDQVSLLSRSGGAAASHQQQGVEEASPPPPVGVLHLLRGSYRRPPEEEVAAAAGDESVTEQGVLVLPGERQAGKSLWLGHLTRVCLILASSGCAWRSMHQLHRAAKLHLLQHDTWRSVGRTGWLASGLAT